MFRSTLKFLLLVLLCGLAGYWIGIRHTATPLHVDPHGAEHPAVAAAPPPVAVSPPARVDPDFVSTATPEARTVPVQLPVTGRLALNRQHLRVAAARVAGRLGRIFVFEGQSVAAGAALAEIYSPEYLSAQREFLLAIRFETTLAREADAQLREDAAGTARGAAGRLKALGASAADIARLRRTGEPEDYLQVRAPIAGVVIQRNVDPGAYLSIGDALMSIADPGALWLDLDTYDTDYADLRLGQALRFTTPALPARTFAATVSFIAPGYDPATHTLAVRCDVANADGALKPAMPVSGLLETGRQAALVLPQRAVVHVRDADVLIVRDNQGFRRVTVHGRALADGEYAVTGGLDADASVVVDGGVLLDQTLAAQ